MLRVGVTHSSNLNVARTQFLLICGHMHTYVVERRQHAILHLTSLSLILRPAPDSGLNDPAVTPQQLASRVETLLQV